jgi:hypothetical protein
VDAVSDSQSVEPCSLHLGIASRSNIFHGWNDQRIGKSLVCAGGVSPAIRLAARANASGVLSGGSRKNHHHRPVIYAGLSASALGKGNDDGIGASDRIYIQSVDCLDISADKTQTRRELSAG